MAQVKRIEPVPKKRSHRVLILENEAECGPYHAMSLIELSVTSGTVFTETLHRELIEHEEALNAYEQGLTYLERGAHSKRELARYLKRKGFSETACQMAIGRLATLEILSDAQLARRLVEQSMHQSVSNRSVAARLAKRGIEGRITDIALREVERDEEKAAMKLAEKKLPELLRRAEKKVERMRRSGLARQGLQKGETFRLGIMFLGQYLSRRGFKPSTVSRVIKQFGASQGEDYEDVGQSDDAEFE